MESSGRIMKSIIIISPFSCIVLFLRWKSLRFFCLVINIRLPVFCTVWVGWARVLCTHPGGPICFQFHRSPWPLPPLPTLSPQALQHNYRQAAFRPPAGSQGWVHAAASVHTLPEHSVFQKTVKHLPLMIVSFPIYPLLNCWGLFLLKFWYIYFSGVSERMGNHLTPGDKTITEIMFDGQISMGNPHSFILKIFPPIQMTEQGKQIHSVFIEF